MASQAYWRYREQKALERRLQQEEDYYKQLDVIFGTMQDEIERQIYAFYARYAENEGITIAEAKKRADALDIEAYARKAARYVDEKNFSPKANAEMALYNLAMKVSRLELLRANIGLEMVAQFDKYADFMEEILDDRTIDELRRQAGILGETIIDNAKMAHEIVNSSFHGATFSDRIWDDQTRLKNEMKKLLQRGLIQGKNPRDLARQLRKVIDTTKHNAERLMRTELARVQIGAQMQSYVDMDFDQYTFHANSSCCDVCKDLNGKHFFIADVAYGENAPPIHPNCRCSTSPYSSDEEYEEWFEDLTGQKSALNMSDEELNNKSDHDDFIKTGGTEKEWAELEKISSGMKMSKPSEVDEFSGTVGRKLNLQERDELVKYAKSNGVKLYRISKFDGDIDLLKHQIDLICRNKKDFQRVFKGKRPTIAFADKMEYGTYAITSGKTIMYDPRIFRDRSFTEKILRDAKQFVNPTIEGITMHEFGHLIEYVYGTRGLTFVNEAYYNLFGDYLDFDEMVEFLRKKYSYYTIPVQVDGITGESDISILEITAEIFSSGFDDEFTRMFIFIWKKRGAI